METNKLNNNVAALLNELATYIRQNAPVKFGELCVKMHVAPSTMYGYIRLLKDMCSDISYSRGIFYVEREPDIAASKEVPVET